jgi:hypothetical protein
MLLKRTALRIYSERSVKKEILFEVRQPPDKFISFSVTQKKFSSYFVEQVLAPVPM